MQIANCKKCDKLFSTTGREICNACFELEEAQFKNMYRILQKSASSGGIDAAELSAQAGVSEDEIEAFYMSGRFSTAGIYLKFRCQACDVMLSDLNRRGRYCVTCSEKTATEAGVEVKPLREIQKEEEKARRQAELETRLKKPPPPSGRHSRSYSFKTNSR